MKIDKIKLYVLEILLLVVLVLAVFESNIITKTVLAIILVIYTLILKGVLKKRKITSIYKRQVLFLFIVFAFLYLALFYLSGLYFGYYKSTVQFGYWGIINYILPITAIIVSSEYLRFILLSQNSKFSKVITFISMVLIDIIVYAELFDIMALKDFLLVIGFTIFSSVSCNLLYNYTSARFGCIPLIVYRLCTSLYCYIIPITPDVMVFFRTVFRMIVPYAIYMFLEYTYSKNSKASEINSRKKRTIGTSIIVVIMLLIVMLISCKFSYGIIVIGSGSMTGTIDKGDAIIYKSYENETINEGDIIVFNYEKSRIIHRVVKTEVVNGEYRYYTKGDANENIDDWYITKSNIVGIEKIKIKYLGYPTIWANDIFNKN